jgi:hypothetical protein
MYAHLYLHERKPENLVAAVNLEVVPRGIYQVGEKLYQYIGQPKFVIAENKSGRDEPYTFVRVELIVEEYKEGAT